MWSHADYLRWLYRSGRPNRLAKLQNRASALAFAAGIWPGRAAALEVRGRTTGRVISFPVVIADYDSERYLVSMLGRDVNWVRNVRAAGGAAVLRHGRREAVHLVEVPVSAKPPILRRYLHVAPGARPHILVDRRAPLQEFEQVAPQIPVFRIIAGEPSQTMAPSAGGYRHDQQADRHPGTSPARRACAALPDPGPDPAG